MALFTFAIPAQYFNASHDTLRMLSIQIVVQFLFYVVHPGENPFFSLLFLQTISFVVIGVIFYWLVVQYLFDFIIDERELTNATEKTANRYNPALHTPELDAIGKHPVSTNHTTTHPLSEPHTDDIPIDASTAHPPH